jgi:hypothetical protein
MRDPRPVATLLLVEVLGGVGLVGWWVTLPARERWLRLWHIGVHEQALAPLQGEGVDQLVWLCDLRLAWLPGLAGLVALAVVFGLCEGAAHRQRDALGGFRLALWTTGVLGLVVLPGVLWGILLAPWPLDKGLVGTGVGIMCGVVAYLLAAGRPWVR